MLIRYGMALLREPEGWCVRRRDLRVEDGRILELGEDLSPRSGESTLSARNALVVPGLVNAHVHSYTNLLKGTAFGAPLELWSLGTVALGGAMTGEDMALSARLGMAEMLRRGVTGCIDHIPHPSAVDPIAEEYAAAGFRACVAPMLHDRSDHLILRGLKEHFPAPVRERLERSAGRTVEDRIKEYEGWIGRHHRPEGTVRMLVAPNSPQRCTAELLDSAGALARRHDLGVHAHLLESRWQRSTAEQEGDPLRWMDRAGLLGRRTSLAHCVWLDEGQIELLRERGCTVVHNPTSNLLLASGRAPVPRFRAAGIPVAFGSDGCNCATDHNMLSVARTALLFHRSGEQDDRRWLPLHDFWDGLTSSGGQAMGYGAELGTLEPGKCADFTVWETDDPAFWPEQDLPLQLLLGLARPTVRHAVVGGRVLLEDGVITAFDEKALMKRLREESPRLRETFRAALAASEELLPWYREAYEARLMGEN